MVDSADLDFLDALVDELPLAEPPQGLHGCEYAAFGSLEDLLMGREPELPVAIPLPVFEPATNPATKPPHARKSAPRPRGKRGKVARLAPAPPPPCDDLGLAPLHSLQSPARLEAQLLGLAPDASARETAQVYRERELAQAAHALEYALGLLKKRAYREQQRAQKVAFEKAERKRRKRELRAAEAAEPLAKLDAEMDAAPLLARRAKKEDILDGF